MAPSTFYFCEVPLESNTHQRKTYLVWMRVPAQSVARKASGARFLLFSVVGYVEQQNKAQQSILSAVSERSGEGGMAERQG